MPRSGSGRMYQMGFVPGDNGRAPRVPVVVTVQYRFDERQDFKSGDGTDLSTSGVFVHTDQPRRVGSMVYLRLALGEGSRLAEGFGRVARVGQGVTGQQGMGIQFIHLDDRSLRVVEELVAGRLGEDRGPV